MNRNNDIWGTRLIWLLWVPWLLKLLDISNFNFLIRRFCGGKSRNEKHKFHYFLENGFNPIFNLFFRSIIIIYFLGCLWYYICFEYKDNSWTLRSFIDMNTLPEMNSFEKMVTSCYFIITTLSTCGFGDFYPVNNFEKVMGIVLMIIGVAFFSNFVGTFINVADSL